jgi:nitroimidazol reductase NimA-like FMN-containing flavoprotein (pyridoxamine 5'-phosphate oxidase superfamily)
MTHFEVTKKNRVARVPERGHYDRETIYQIVDEAMVCHVGLVENDEPVVIPTLHARKGDEILLHGATKSRLMQCAQSGQKLCIAITLVDGLVLARSVFHHSVNYRSVVLFGRGQPVPEEEKLSCLEAFTERLLPGRWNDARQPDEAELAATAIVSVPIELASAKVRVGPPGDDEADLGLPVWAGVLPIKQKLLTPERDSLLDAAIDVPPYLLEFVARKNR